MNTAQQKKPGNPCLNTPWRPSRLTATLPDTITSYAAAFAGGCCPSQSPLAPYAIWSRVTSLTLVVAAYAVTQVTV